MPEYEVIGAGSSGGVAEPSDADPEDPGQARRALWLLVPALLAIVAAVALSRGGNRSGEPPAESEAAPAATTTTTGSAPEPGRSTDPTQLDDDEVEALLATFDDLVLIGATDVDNPDGNSRVFVRSVATGERFDLPIDGIPLAVVDEWLIVETLDSVVAVDLRIAAQDPVRLMSFDDPKRGVVVEVLPDSLWLVSVGLDSHAAQQERLVIGTWDPLPVPSEVREWGSSFEIAWSAGSGTYRATEDHYDRISDGLVVGMNRDYLVIETCEDSAYYCRTDWLDRASLEPVETPTNIGNPGQINLAPEGGIVIFGQKFADVVGGEGGFVVASDNGWSEFVARNEEAALIGNGQALFVVDIETGRWAPAGRTDASSPFMRGSFVAGISGHPMLEEAVGG